MSMGGENLELVIGRGEEEELPTFEPGSFEIEVGIDQRVNGNKLVSQEFLDQFVPEGVVVRHTMRSLLDSIRSVNSDEFKCLQHRGLYIPLPLDKMKTYLSSFYPLYYSNNTAAVWVDEPRLLVTRFEYANLFHTVTDWYSAYAASRVTGMPTRPHLVVLDGHCKPGMESDLDPTVAERVVMDKHQIDGRTVEAKKAVPRDDQQHIPGRSNNNIHGSPVPTRTKEIFVGGLASTVTETDCSSSILNSLGRSQML
ncbi:hypothetical protein MKW98_024175 [Papaver atlanticum]|uniref:Uncharacterized protein n=1 Tax=Papaver atlanticum TaxID=357466 RepID=A0AAD4T062_9MAGN|nr:hypothetical protein MKW98_024175 [Papaver atlanticum]